MENFILVLKYIWLGIVQGLAEILPISSSGHLAIFQKLLKMEEDGLAFEVFLHFASLIAIIFCFRKRIWELIKDFFLFIFKREKEVGKLEVQKNNFNYCIFLVLATIPAALLGVILTKFDIIEKYLSQLWVVGCFLYLTAILLYVSTKIKRNKEIKDMKWYDAVTIGLFQCLGVLPGISRSGSCLVGTGFRKVDQKESAEFVFMMAIPMILGSAIVSVGDVVDALSANTFLILPYVLSFVITAVITYFCLKFFLVIIRKQKLSYFSIYCFVVGTIAIILNFVL